MISNVHFTDIKKSDRLSVKGKDSIHVLTESEKFSKRGIVPLNLKEQVKAVITDKDIDSYCKAELENKRIKVITA